MKNPHRLVFAIVLVGVSASVHSDERISSIWKCVAEDGRPFYTHNREEAVGKNCEVVSRTVSVDSAPAPAPKKLTKKAEEDRRLKIAALLEAESKAVIACQDKAACDKVFSLTQIYINQTADQKIQLATDTIVETYNPAGEGKMGLRAVRIPGKGTSATIRLTANCKSEASALVNPCVQRKTNAYSGFRPFIESMLKE